MEIITCKVCGMPLKRYQKKYCSRSCYGVAIIGRKLSAETKKKISMAGLGEKNHFYGKTHSDDSKKKISDALKGRRGPNLGRKFSEEFKRNVSKSKRGKNNPNYGKPRSEKTKKKISENAKKRFRNKENHPCYGKHLSEETKLKISGVRRGIIFSEEHKRNLSKAHKGKFVGKNSPRYGKSPKWKHKKYHKKGIDELGHSVRSSWEFNFAKFLQDNGIEYEYEPKRFEVVVDGRDLTYTPDFYIPEQDNGGLWILPFPPNNYVEIKGYMQDLAKKKIEYFRGHYGKLIVLDKDNIINIVNLRETNK